MDGAAPAPARPKRPRHLRGLRRARSQEDEWGNDWKLRKTISSDHLLHERLDSPDFPPETPPGSVSSNSSSEKKNDNDANPSRALAKKKKYFSEKSNNKNIFKKLIHPSYQERAGQYRRLFGAKIGPEPDEFLASAQPSSGLWLPLLNPPIPAFSCAYQREILCQGRMYISQRHICFYANIFGWETNLVLPICDVTAVTKEKAALIFPNSIQIEMQDETRHFFASFVNREKSLTVLLKVLEKVQHGELMSPEELWEYMNVEDEEKRAHWAPLHSQLLSWFFRRSIDVHVVVDDDDALALQFECSLRAERISRQSVSR
ncbi:unnamed protein product [Heligmosomoides polygyrus]|uniref:GRAM domain-containing protein n=1 Tax=Heligmosomoides polygyrus TaxID=6339 RepID=A0A3P8FXD1_HELPZ|nr:unnamed protein product [Heligmosomoides polygyrus]